MSISSLLDELRGVGGEVQLHGEELRIKAPKGAISKDLQVRLKANRDALREILKGAEAAQAVPVFPPIDETAPGRTAPLSHAQQRLWFLEQLSPGTSFLNVPGRLRIRGNLDEYALSWAVSELGRRHDALRLAIDSTEGVPHQVCHDVETRLAVRDVASLPKTERRKAVDDACDEIARKPFDASQAPLFRFELLREAEDDHTLAMAGSHLVFDGSSRDLLVRDLRALYESRVLGDAAPPPPRLRFPDFARWHRSWLEQAPLARETEFWKRHLAGMPMTLDLPTDRPRAPTMSYEGHHESFVIEPALLAALRKIAQSQRATVSMLGLAAAELELSRYTGQPDFAVGMPVHGRFRPECEPVIGMFVNTLVMRSAVPAGGTFAELLGRVRDSSLDALANQNLPFDQLVQAVQPPRDRSRTPVFQAMYSHQRLMGAEAGRAGLTFEDEPLFAGAAATDITFWLFEYDDHAVATVETASHLFGQDTTARLARSYSKILMAVAENADALLDGFPVLAEEDERKLLFGLNDTQAPWDSAALVHPLFEAVARARPAATALLFEDQSLTYAELDARANRVANALVKRGVVSDSRVGVFLRRGVDLVVALLGVLKAGGGYVPLDPMFPADRIEYVLADSAAQVLVTTSDLAALLSQTPETLLLDGDPRGDAGLKATPPDAKGRPDQLAYVIYTSGSTGRPKGVMVEHRNVVSFFAGMERAIGLSGGGVWLSATTVAFDISVLEILGSLCHGRTVALLGETVLGAIEDPRYTIPALVKRHRVTHFQCTPTQCRMLLLDEDGRDALGALRQLVVGGEALHPDLAYELADLVKGEVVNAYGPTETTVWSTTSKVVLGAPVSVGRPIANTIVFVVDAAGRPVPFGATGELCIGGPGVTRGYLNRPELTEEKFVPNRLRPDLGGRLYRTGDLVRYAADGTISYLGRNDHQVKIRGFRIELGEIETLLRKVPGVEDAAVVAQANGGDQRLVAYVVANPSFAGDAAARNEVRTKLPEYMVPAVLVHLDALPLTANGKLNRKALPEPTAVVVEESEFVSPKDQYERTLAEVWAAILRVERVSVTDDFFALGGHSLLAVQIFNAIQQEFDVRLPLATLFERPTVQLLAEKLRELAASGNGQAGDGWNTVVPMRASGKHPPFFCVAGLGGNPMNLIHFARALGDDQPFYGLQHRGVDGQRSPHRTIQAMAEEFYDHIRKVQRHGPYYVGGFSAGGLPAYELARMLLDAGEEVGLVVLLDTSNPKILQWPLRERIAAHITNLRNVGLGYIATRSRAMVQRNIDIARRNIRAKLGAKYRFEYRYDEVVEATLAAERGYEPEPLASNVLLIQADSEVPAMDGVGYPPHESNGWRDVVSRGLEIVQIECQHLNLVTEANSPITAKVVTESLARARASAGPRGPVSTRRGPQSTRARV